MSQVWVLSMAIGVLFILLYLVQTGGYRLGAASALAARGRL